METIFRSPEVMSRPWEERWLGYALTASRDVVLSLVLSLGVGPGVGLVVGLVVGLRLGWWLGYFRLYYLPWHAAFWILRRSPGSYRYHPVAWDWCCFLPFPFLDRLLVSYAELDRSRIEPEIRRLVAEVPGQKTPALRALTILLERRAAQIGSLTELSQALEDLPEGERGFLRQNRRVRELAEAVVQQQMRVDATSGSYFREIEARNLVAEIRNFQSRISGMKEPITSEFRKASEAWLRLAEEQQRTAAKGTQAEPAPQVFRAGDPLEREREAFVPRFRVLEELEGQIMLGSGCPGVLLRGPRRMGKSSLLKNVKGFLPAEVVVAYVSLQSAQAFSSTAHFVGALSQAVAGVLASLPASVETRESLGTSPPVDLAGFLHFLNECNSALERGGLRLLLALDEYEMLDEKLREGVFTTDLLATVRESIQSHRRITWTFSGNADIMELTGSDWTSYLISVRTLSVPVFTAEETHLLLTEPLKHSALQGEDKAASALFWKEFWGDEGIARIHAESGGWPYFVQLIAETVVTLANESATGERTLPPALLDRAMDECVERGRNAFHQLLRSQCRVPGEWEFLEGFARRETQPAPEAAEVRRSLNRRQLLIEASAGEWALRVPLMARWLKKEW